MSTEEVAKKLVALCREGKFEEVIQELYSPNIVSIEPEGGPWGTVQGFEAIAKKGKEWNEMVEKQLKRRNNMLERENKSREEELKLMRERWEEEKGQSS